MNCIYGKLYKAIKKNNIAVRGGIASVNGYVFKVFHSYNQAELINCGDLNVLTRIFRNETALECLTKKLKKIKKEAI